MLTRGISYARNNSEEQSKADYIDVLNYFALVEVPTVSS